MTEAPVPTAAATTGAAPLLEKLLAQQAVDAAGRPQVLPDRATPGARRGAAQGLGRRIITLDLPTGLPPAYLPKDEQPPEEKHDP